MSDNDTGYDPRLAPRGPDVGSGRDPGPLPPDAIVDMNWGGQPKTQG